MTGPKVLVTRAEPGASETAGRLAVLGYVPVISPAIRLGAIAHAAIPYLGDAVGLIFTSANGVSFFTRLSARRDLTAWCVGPATARAARSAGFQAVCNAAGDAGDLADLIRSEGDPLAGRLIHVANAAAAGQLAKTLQQAGFSVEFAALYESAPAGSLTDEAQAALAAGRVGAVLFHSAKGARAFAALAGASGADLSAVQAVGVSEKALQPVSGMNWAQLRAAHAPNESALISALQQVLTPA